MQANDPSDTSFTMKLHDDKLPHDASVFVGSLPSNIDQGELTRLLLDHLSEHTQIKNIKVVRDSKGGVCAFVQCENAASAIALMQTLHSNTPKPFLGRILRYEPARAFRTLLISYRAPTQPVRSTGHPTSPSSVINNEVDLELPSAMRIWKHGNSRFHSILYNLEAVQNEENWGGISSEDNAVFFHPLRFDEEALHKLVTYFGCLEKFSPLQLGAPDEGTDCENEEMRTANTNHGSFPAPHCARRSPAMEKQCWEVKWEHRDDCVSALMTLRRVPHLTVTWAHQPASIGHHIPGSPSYFPYIQRQVFTSPISPSILRPRARQDTGHVDDIFAANTEAAHGQVLSQSYGSTNFVPAARESANDSWAEEECNISTKNDLDSSFDNGGMTPAMVMACARRKAPLLQTLPGSEEPPETCKADAQPEVACAGVADVNRLAEGEGQELYIPQTPVLDGSLTTPLTPGSQFPITPTDCEADVSQDTFYKKSQSKESGNPFKVSGTEREVDPTSLFVGGLEMFGPGAWDEEKVKNFFSRFGGLESVKVVRPVNSCAAFAFVKFDNPESPSRAVFEEHNRVYGGRAMRVQLRDCNPSRNKWKYGRGRGRPHYHPLGTQRKFHFRPPYEGQGHMPPHAQNDKMNFKDPANVSEIQLSALADALPSLGPPKDNNLSGSGCAQPPALALDIVSSSRDSTPGEKYREWYDAPESPTHTPQPSPLGSSVSTAGPSFSAPPYSYTIPTGPYFPSPPWAHPQMPYQVPYYTGYTVYPPSATPQLQQPVTSPSSSETSGPESGPQHPWPHMGMYASYIPYPTVPSRPPLMEQGQPQHIAAKAPLIPTGFIQNEQGTLIAVYQPEALDQYLAGSRSVSATAARQPHEGLPRWGNATPYPCDMGSTHPINNPYSTPNQGRFKSPGIPAAPSRHFPDYQQQSPTPLRGMGSSPFNTPPPLYRRQGSRRETQQNYNAVRHVHPQIFNGRPLRGGNNAHVQTADLEHPVGQPPINNGEWNRWNGAG